MPLTSVRWLGQMGIIHPLWKMPLVHAIVQLAHVTLAPFGDHGKPSYPLPFTGRAAAFSLPPVSCEAAFQLRRSHGAGYWRRHAGRRAWLREGHKGAGCVKLHRSPAILGRNGFVILLFLVPSSSKTTARQ